MSQAGIIDIEGSHPQIPTSFVTNVGTAIPIANILEILATTVLSHSIPIETTGSGNTVTIVVQYASATASSVAANAGFASFNSTEFTVDANGYVSLSGTGTAETITGNVGGPLSPTAGNWNILGISTAAGTTPVQTSGAVSTLTVQVQKSQAIASTNASNVGLAAFNSTYFTVDANGFVSLVASSEAGSFAVDASTSPGTNPVLPNASGIVTVTGGQVAAGTTTSVIRTDSLAANTYTIQIQRSQAVASSTIGDNGVSHFNSTYFTVDANGFVSLNGGAVGETITGNTGGALSPTSGNWNILGTSTAAGTTPVQTSGSVSTLTVQVQKAQAIASTDATKVGLAAFNSAQFSVDANGFVALNGAAVGETITGQSGGALSPTAGNWNIYGGTAAAGTTPVITSGSGSTLTTNVQRSQAIASTDSTKVGLSNFNNAQFSVDSNGFVSASGAIATTYTENSGTATPSSGNLNILGTNTALTGYSPWTVGSGATVTLNMPGTVKWVVNATSGLGTHTTIASAITSASSGDDIFLTAGTYTENITLKAGVNLVAHSGDDNTPNVTILGTVTANYTGTVTIANINLQTNSAVAISQTGSNATILNLYQCNIQASNANAITYSTSNASAILFIRDSNINILTANLAWAATSTGSMTLINCDITGTTNALSTVNATNLSMRYCRCFSNISFTAATAKIEFTSFPNPNAINITTATSGTYQLYFCEFEGGSNSCISIGASTTVIITQSQINSGATNAITGAGTIQYGNLFFNSTSTINTTTQSSSGTIQGSRNTAPSAGFLGEQMVNAATGTAVSNGTPKTIATVTLTPGVWDITGVLQANGSALVGTGFSIGISTTTNAFTGNFGDSVLNVLNSSAVLSNAMGGAIPGFRVVISASISYFLVGQYNFSSGTATMSGRLSAVRVG